VRSSRSILCKMTSWECSGGCDGFGGGSKVTLQFGELSGKIVGSHFREGRKRHDERAMSLETFGGWTLNSWT